MSCPYFSLATAGKLTKPLNTNRVPLLPSLLLLRSSISLKYGILTLNRKISRDKPCLLLVVKREKQLRFQSLRLLHLHLNLKKTMMKRREKTKRKKIPKLQGGELLQLGWLSWVE